MLPKVSNYAYLGVNFASNGAWDHVKDVCVKVTIYRLLINIHNIIKVAFC